MNFLAAVQRVKQESGRSGSGPGSVATATGDDLRIVRWVQQAWQDIQNLPRNWRWMRATVVGEVDAAEVVLPLTAPARSYWMPANEHYQPTAYDAANPGNEWVLRQLDYDLFRQHVLTGPRAPGAPQVWTVAPDGRMLIGPMADVDDLFGTEDGEVLGTEDGDPIAFDVAPVYKVRADYFREPTELVSDSDVPAMPARFHMLLVWGALMQLAGFDAAPELLSRAALNYDAMLDALIDDQGERPRFGCNRF